MMRLFKSVRSITGSKESQASGRRRRKSVSWLLAGLVATGLGGTSGCSREYYRKSADEQADLLIHEKETDPRWMLPDRSIYMDPHSRYFDPNDPDHSPLPPDDPASHEFMHCLYGMKGSKKWHKNGELTELVNAGWKNYLSELMEKTEDGEYVLDLQDAVQLSLLQSPRFQTNVETLYLSALDVAFERFRFDTQFFAGNGTLWSHRANEFVHRNNQGLSIPGEPSSVLTTANAARATKLLPTGGQFMADFANTFVWQFAGTNENTRADSLLGFTFLQPLLRQGGREIALEQLTIAERALLANVRQMEWYRQGFLLDVAIGTGAGQGPQRRGGFLGGAGLSGFTGTGAGGFGGVGEASSFGRLGGAGGAGGGAGGAAGGGFAAGVAGNVSGFIGLVQQAQQIHNRQTNLQLQQENLARTSELAKAGRIESLQVDQFRQNVQSTRSQLLGFEYQFQTNVENFLISTMGLPPDVPVHIDESIVKPFQFTEPKLSELREHMRVFIERTRSMEDPSLDILGKLVDYFQQMRTSMIERFDVVRQDFQNLESVEQQRLESLHNEADRKEFLDEVARLTIDFTQLEKRFHATAQDILRPSQLLKTEKGEDVKQELVKQADSATEILRELALVQAGVRLEAVVLQPVNLDGEHAFHIAQANRLDIMNQRGEVVDQWRLITFNANRLESDLNVEFSGSFGTLDRNIVNFRDQTGSFSAAVRFDTPITRLGERNLYRQSLIDYQRVRREYIQFEDRVKRSLRNTLSGVILFDQEIELRRKALRIAIRVVDLSEEKLKAPPKPGAPPSETAVRDLLAALSDLLSTQDSIMNTYLNYQQLRMTLYRDLGVIRFDDRGMWIDEPLEAVLERLGPAPFVPPPLPPTENLQAASGSEESSDVVTVAAEQVDDQIALASKTNPPGESSETEVEAAEAAQPLPVAVLLPEKKSIAPFPKRAWGRALPFLAHRPNNESAP